MILKKEKKAFRRNEHCLIWITDKGFMHKGVDV